MPDLKPSEVIHFLLIVRELGVAAVINWGQETGGLGVLSGAGGKGDREYGLGLEVELERIMAVGNGNKNGNDAGFSVTTLSLKNKIYKSEVCV